MPPYGIDTLLNRNFDAQGFFESPVESSYDPAFGTLNYQTAYGPAPYTGNIPLTSYRLQPGIENLSFEGAIDLPSFGGSGNPRFNQFGKDIDFINAPQNIYRAAVPPDFVNVPQNIYPPNLTSTKGLPTLNLQSLPANMGVANEDDVEQEFLPDQKKSTGIMDVIMSIAIPGYGFLKNIGRGGLEGIRGLNQKIQQSDFGQSKTLADYFDARSYGGRDARDRAASQNMREARAIQRQVDMRPSAVPTNQDRGRGQSFSAPTRSAAATRSRDLGSMRGGVGR
jgi:hypothetical protein